MQLSKHFELLAKHPKLENIAWWNMTFSSVRSKQTVCVKWEVSQVGRRGARVGERGLANRNPVRGDPSNFSKKK